MGDLSILKTVVIVLGLALLGDLVVMALLLLDGMPIPGTLETLAVAIVTGLLGLLAPSRTVTQGQ